MKPRTLGIIIGVIVLVALGFILFPLPQPIIALAPEAIFSIGGIGITNTMITSWVMIAVICIGIKLGTRRLSMVPSGFQNAFEAVVEGFGNIANNVAGEKNGRRFFPVVFILFLYIVLSNWAALTPIFNVIGKVDNVGADIRKEAFEQPDERVAKAETVRAWVMKDAGGLSVVPLFTRTKLVEVPVAAGTSFRDRCIQVEQALAQKLGREGDPARACTPPAGAAEAEGAGTVEGTALRANEKYASIAPFLRGVNTDVNAPLGYALWSAIFVEFWGLSALGIGYLTKFFNFKKLLRGDIVNGGIDVFVGILEFISELSRLISFTFRLFGNISAGEILLFMMSFLVPFVLIDVFYGLELFVGIIQAFVFAMLTLVFGVMAVSGHGDAHEDGHGHGAAEHAETASGAHGPAHV